MANNNTHNRPLKVLINIGIQLCYYGINWHIIMVLVTFWIKSRLINIVREVNKIIELQRKLQQNIYILINIKQYQGQDYFVHLTSSNKK